MFLLMLIPTVFADNTTIVGANPFQFNTCPSDTFGLALYFGMGAFLLVIFWMCKKLIRVPLITIFIAIGFFIWSTMGLWGCSLIFGVVGVMFALGIVAFEFISTVIK